MIEILSFFIVLLLLFSGFLAWRLFHTNKSKQELHEKFNTLELKIDNLKLDTLESRLNPHLFKNILNSIQSHAYQTYFTLDKLANVLDYILYDSQQKFVTPKQEIEFALNLIDINKIKISPLFEMKVKLKINENEKLYEQQIMAPLISIDLIENAFKHADLQSPDAFIAIVLEFKDHTFSLTVSNKISDKVAMQKGRSGLGVTTLEQRLKIIYKDQYQLEKFVDNSIYTAHLKINLLEYKTKMHLIG